MSRRYGSFLASIPTALITCARFGLSVDYLALSEASERLTVTSQTPLNISTIAIAFIKVNLSRPSHIPTQVATIGWT